MGGLWRIIGGSLEDHGRQWKDHGRKREGCGMILEGFCPNVSTTPINTGMQEGPGRITGGSLEDCWNIVRGSWEDCERLFVQSIVIGS